MVRDRLGCPCCGRDAGDEAFQRAGVRYRRVVLGEYKRQTVPGRGDGLRWCPRWWAHPLALDRLESLWRAWEALRLDPGTRLSVWYRDHFAPALADLTGADGPFRQPTPERVIHNPVATPPWTTVARSHSTFDPAKDTEVD